MRRNKNLSTSFDKYISNDYYHLVSVNPPRKYYVPFKDKQKFWKEYCNIIMKKSECLTLAQPRRYFSMLTFDFDYEEKGKEVKFLFTTKDIKYICEKILKEIIPNNLTCYFKTNIRPENLTLTLFIKKPYIKNGETIKHGFHLQSLNLFPSKEARIKILEQTKKYNDHCDLGASYNPWLLYGSCKNKESGSYKVSKTFRMTDGLLEMIDTDQYIRDNIRIFSHISDQLIEYKYPIQFYYPIIFNSDRNLSSIEGNKYSNHQELVLKFKDEKEIVKYKEEEREECDNDEVFHIVNDYIGKNDDIYKIDRYINEDGFFRIIRKKPGQCLISDQYHDRLHSWGREINGKIIIGCFSQKCKGNNKILKNNSKKKIKVIFQKKRETIQNFSLN